MRSVSPVTELENGAAVLLEGHREGLPGGRDSVAGRKPAASPSLDSIRDRP